MSEGGRPRRAGPDVAGYDDLEMIGRGGFATVYRAQQLAFRREVALKVLDGTDADQQTVRLFERECEAAGALSWHPHVVPVYDAGKAADGTPYLAMELLEGGSLEGVLASRGALSELDALRVCSEVASALEAAHQIELLHRDLKPANILLDRWGRARLTDFGIARLASTGTLTTTGVITGTVAYLAPEVLAGGRASPASDVYALGMTLWTLVAGANPYSSATDDTPFAVIARVIEGRLPPLPTHVSPQVQQIIRWWTAREPTERPATASEARSAIGAIPASGHPTHVHPGHRVADDMNAIDHTGDPTDEPVTAESAGSGTASSNVPTIRPAGRFGRFAPTVIDRKPQGSYPTPSPSRETWPTNVSTPAEGSAHRTHAQVAGGRPRRRGLTVATTALVAVIAIAVAGLAWDNGGGSTDPSGDVARRDDAANSARDDSSDRGGDDGRGGGGGALADVDFGGSAVTVGSKDFDEQLLLGQILIQALEATGANVTDSTDTGGTQVVREALLNGDVDVYPEYNGTGWTEHLGNEDPSSDPTELFEAVRDQDLADNNIHWLGSSEFNNTYGFATSAELVEENGGEPFTFDTMAEHLEENSDATVCMESEFPDRTDGLVLWEEATGFQIPESQITILDTNVIYTETANGECDFGEIFTTDGRIEGLELVLVDDPGVMIIYNVSITVRGEVYDENPEAWDTLADAILAGLDQDTMNELNKRVSFDGDDPAEVAADYLADQGLVDG